MPALLPSKTEQQETTRLLNSIGIRSLPDPRSRLDRRRMGSMLQAASPSPVASGPSRILRLPPLLAKYHTIKPAIAQLVEHLTVECCGNQMVPGSIPGGRK